MDEDPDLAIEAAERQRLIEVFRRTGNEAFLRAALCLRRRGTTLDRADILQLLRDGEPRPVGRPDTKDRESLVEMGMLLAKGRAKNRTDAARQVARNSPGHSLQATIHRLREKFKEEQASIELEVDGLLAVERSIELERQAVETAKRHLQSPELQSTRVARAIERELEQQRLSFARLAKQLGESKGGGIPGRTENPESAGPGDGEN